MTLLFIMLFVILAPQHSHSFSNRLITVGSRGNDVIELQSRLQYLGYHHGVVDGVFGPVTNRSVRNFQSQFGLTVDGVVGSQTRNMLVRATQNWSPSRTTSTPVPPSSKRFSDNDMKLLAQAVYSEARGEPYEGQVAVAAVILNRYRSSLFPDSISGVIFEPRAFTAVDDGQFWLTPNQSAHRAVKDAINGWDPSQGALYYFNPDTATSAWIWTRPQIKKIGKHIFCR